MNQFLIDAFPYFAWGAAAFNAACLVAVIRNGRRADRALDEAHRVLDELASKRA